MAGRGQWRGGRRRVNSAFIRVPARWSGPFSAGRARICAAGALFSQPPWLLSIAGSGTKPRYFRGYGIVLQGRAGCRRRWRFAKALSTRFLGTRGPYLFTGTRRAEKQPCSRAGRAPTVPHEVPPFVWARSSVGCPRSPCGPPRMFRISCGSPNRVAEPVEIPPWSRSSVGSTISVRHGPLMRLGGVKAAMDHRLAMFLHGDSPPRTSKGTELSGLQFSGDAARGPVCRVPRRPLRVASRCSFGVSEDRDPVAW